MLEGINIFHQVFPIQASAAEPLKVSSLHFELDAAGILLLHDIGSSNKHLPARIIESTNMRESDVKDKQQPNKVSTQTPPANQFWCLLVHLVSRIFGKLLFNHVQASCSIDYSAKNTFRELCLQVLLKKHACCIATLLPETLPGKHEYMDFMHDGRWKFLLEASTILFLLKIFMMKAEGSTSFFVFHFTFS